MYIAAPIKCLKSTVFFPRTKALNWVAAGYQGMPKVRMSSRVNHYEEEEWLDFARALLPADQLEMMRKHLDSPCERCIRTCAIWQAIVEFAAFEQNYEPPASLIRSMKVALRRRQDEDAKSCPPPSSTKAKKF